MSSLILGLETGFKDDLEKFKAAVLKAMEKCAAQNGKIPATACKGLAGFMPIDKTRRRAAGA